MTTVARHGACSFSVTVGTEPFWCDYDEGHAGRHVCAVAKASWTSPSQSWRDPPPVTGSCKRDNHTLCFESWCECACHKAYRS